MHCELARCISVHIFYLSAALEVVQYQMRKRTSVVEARLVFLGATTTKSSLRFDPFYLQIILSSGPKDAS